VNRAIGGTEGSKYAEHGWAQRGSHEDRVGQVAVPVAERERAWRQPKPYMVGDKGFQDKAEETDDREPVTKQRYRTTLRS
jgi:hypothetical protein